MNYVIVELQESNSGPVAIVPPTAYSDQRIAEQAFHTALAAAAVSSVDAHSVVMLDGTGKYLKGETYYHAS